MVKFNKKGSVAFVWVIVLISLLLGALIYIITNQFVSNFYENNLKNQTGENKVVVDKLFNLWDNIPIIIFFGLVIGLIGYAISRRGGQNDTGYYGP